jgi:integrase
MKSIYTTPKIVKYDDLTKAWFVYFRYNKKLFRFKYGINYIQNYKQRLLEAQALQSALLEKLKQGWNPDLPDIYNQINNYTLIEALDFALDKKKSVLAKKSIADYSCTLNFIKTAISALFLENIQINEVKRIHIKTILDKIKEQRCSTNNSYNKYLTHFGAILSELIQYDIIEFNPADKIKHLPIEESIFHKPASLKDIEIIKKELYTKDHNFYNFVSVIFHLGIRPDEILQIKLSMIDFENEIITLIPKNTKGRKKYRILPINRHLMSYFEKLELSDQPKDFYLFGSFRHPGKGNVGPKLDFISGPTRIKVDTATRRWESIVKIGLKINMTMYAMKKHGANMKLSSGISLEAISEQFGHSKVETTKIYTTMLNEINRNEVLLKSPEF